MRENCLIVMAKSPAAGAAKTRLASVIGSQGAARLAAAFLGDTLELARSLDAVTVMLSYAPPSARAELACLAGDAAVLHEQPEGDLGARLEAAIQAAFAAGARRVAAIAVDSPTLPPAVIEDALLTLKRRRVVIGPALDGGYYLIGTSKPLPHLFERIDWSTERVFAQTLERARELRLAPFILPSWYDVDDAGGLERLFAELHSSDCGCRRTRVVLSELELESSAVAT